MEKSPSSTTESPALTASQFSRPISEHPIAVFLRFLYEIIKTVLAVLLFAIIIRYLFIQPFIVDGSSMEPTFQNHEYLMVEKVNYFLHPPARGDIVVFKYPLNPSLNYVKRVIGVPGDRVVIAGGAVTIYNTAYPTGLRLNEVYLAPGLVTKVNGDVREKTWYVDDRHYYVLGDNRNHSDDSRSWGLVPEQNVIGKVWLTVYPFSDFGAVNHAQY